MIHWVLSQLHLTNFHHSLIIDLTELLQDRDRVLRKIRIVACRYHLRGEKLNDFRVRHSIVVVRIDLLHEVANVLHLQLNAHSIQQHSELLLVKVTNFVLINLLEEVCEVVQELLVLVQLEIEDHFLEVLVPKLALVLFYVVQDLFSGKLPAGVLVQLLLVQLLNELVVRESA